MQNGFFLGANSKDGFVSRYHTLSEVTEKLYIIKASPGGGKSTFMKRVAECLGDSPECIYCSSDPNSLDAVIFPKYKVAIADGTSPHVLEPAFHLASEEYLNLGVFADASKLDRTAVIETTNRYKARFSRVYRLTACAGILREEACEIAQGGVSLPRIVKKAAGILSREVRPLKKRGYVTARFLSAVSPFGYVTLFDTVSALCDRVYVLEDSYNLGAPLLSELLCRAVELGHTVYACHSPLCPDVLEHLILPDARLGFVTSTALQHYPHTPTRRIRLDAMIDREYRKAHRGKLKFTTALGAELLDMACEELREAKLIHDDLEALYHPCIDFDGILECADKLAQKIRGIS